MESKAVNMKRIRQGNKINFRYNVYRLVGKQKEPEDLTGLKITAVLRNKLYGNVVKLSYKVEGNVITAQIPGIPYLKTGVYNFCLSYQKDGNDFTVDTDVFQIVDSSAKAGGEDACPSIETETVELSGSVEFGLIGGSGIEQIQSDWEETNPASKAFIRRKPVLSKVATSGSYADLTGTPVIPTVTNDFTDDEKTKLAGLSNYDDTPIRTALQDEINRATGEESDLRKAIQKVALDFSTFLSSDPDADNIINRWQEVTAFLNGITEDKTLSGMLLEMKNQINESVQAKLSDYYTAARTDELFVKKLVGSRLITEEEVAKLAGLTNYDDTEVRNLIEKKANPIPVKSVSDPNGSVDVYAIDPNVFYDFDYCGTLHLSLNPSKDSGLLNEYMFQFISADSSTTLAIDGPVQWLNGQPALKPDYLYQVSIVNNLAIIGGTKYGEV